MTLAAGTHVGPYEVAAPIGAGGMGEVYKARDTRLNRTVAIKVLATHLTNRPDLRARFDREAQTLASLSHPHICPVFDVGRHDGADYIVMEYIEGGTLADRLRRGPVPVDEALQIATAIADALDNAHRQGIVHRDLKPGNIMLTKSGAKLLDFGLAKLKQEASLFNTATTSPAGVPITAEGTILGTIQYMAPEQLEGKEADARTDIFAFGAVVHEMITGDKTFEGSSQASLIAAILDRDPPSMSTRQPMTPPLLDRVVRKCLTKNPERRWQSAGDLRDELRWIAEGTQSAEGPRPSRGANYKRLAYSATTAAVLLAGAVVILGIRSPPPSAPPEEVRFDIAAPNIPNPRQLTISPDGRWIAFPASTETRRTALFVRRIDSTSLEQLAGTEGAARPFWAPDSQSIGFFVGGKVKKIGVSGGPVQNICDAPGTQDGGTWNHDGIVIFSSGGILRRVAASGGEPVQIRAPDASRQETLHVFPSFLPDGKHFLYLAWSNQQARRATYVGSLESTDVVKLFDSQSQVIYAPPGFLLFHKNGSLLAQPFDPDKIVLTGSISRIVDEVSYNALSGEAAFAVSNSQRLIYRAGGGPAVSREFVWSDRTGHREGTIGNPGIYTANFDLSPEGTRIAVAQRNGENAQDRYLGNRCCTKHIDTVDLRFGPEPQWQRGLGPRRESRGLRIRAQRQS